MIPQELRIGQSTSERRKRAYFDSLKAGEVIIENHVAPCVGTRAQIEKSQRAKHSRDYIDIRFNWNELVDPYGEVVSGEDYAKQRYGINGACAVIGKRRQKI